MVLVTPYRKNKISLTLQIFFLLMHAVTAFDYGFLKRKSAAAKIAVKVFTLLQCAGVCFLTLYEFALPENEKELIVVGVWLLILSTQYIYNCLVLVFSYDGSFYVLLKTLLYVDDLLAVDSKSYSTDFTIVGACSVSVTVRVINNLMYCVYFPLECTKSSFINSMIISQIVMTDLTHLMLFLILHTITCRLKMLNNIIKNSDRRIAIYIKVYKTIVVCVEKNKISLNYLLPILFCLDGCGNDNLRLQQRENSTKLIQCNKTTNILFPLVLLVSSTIELMYLMALAYKVTELTGVVYLFLLNMKNGENMFVDDQFVRSMYTSQVVVLLFLPSIAAGFLAAEAEKLKLILYEKLIIEKDEDQASFLELFIEYVSARPLRQRMVKVVPLDWTLPILVMDFIISYQIIIVQLTNLY